MILNMHKLSVVINSNSSPSTHLQTSVQPYGPGYTAWTTAVLPHACNCDNDNAWIHLSGNNYS